MKLMRTQTAMVAAEAGRPVRTRPAASDAELRGLLRRRVQADAARLTSLEPLSTAEADAIADLADGVALLRSLTPGAGEAEERRRAAGPLADVLIEAGDAA